MMRSIHQVIVALWFGSVAFFTVAGLLIFQAFEDVALSSERPAWLPVVPLYSGTPPEGFPEPLAREQGSRAAGVAVSGVFPFFFALQSACGLLALLTAWSLGGPWRRGLCLAGLLIALSGWGIERSVHHLRLARNQLTDAALADPTPTKLTEARAARAAFGKWHGISLLVNFAALGLTLSLAALPLPERT
ncbi:MAG: hypothetical protein SNJ75_15685 [Gemmataceae bacterium]